MSNIEKIRQEIERRLKYTHDWLRGDEKRHPKQTAISKNYYKMKGDERTLDALLAFIDSLPEDASCVYDTNKLTPTPSANIEDVARVQFASHAKVFDKKRKAVFDWEQFKEVAGIFYGFGKRDSMPEEKPSEDFPTSDEEMAKFLATHPKVEVPEKYKTPNWLFDKPSEDLEEAAKKRKMGITPIGIIRMKVQELKWADVDKAGNLDIHPLEKEKYDYSIKQCDKIIAFIDNLPLTIAKESPVLNEAADDYQTTFNKTIGPFYHDDQKRAFIAGAKWHEQQMMKDYILKETVKRIARGSLGVQDFIRKIDKYKKNKQDDRPRD